MTARILSTILLLAVTAMTNASVIDYADVNGFTTFQDTNTGRVWLDMDNFFDETANVGTTGFDMITAAQNAGFTFATQAEVAELLNTLPLGGGEWASYAAVMGYGIPRALIWGMYDDLNGNPYGWAWAYSSDSIWNYSNDSTDAATIQNENNQNSVDMGIWAYQTGIVNADVPEPLSLSLLGLGLAGLAFSRRRAKA